MKIYTRTGDKGETSLYGGARISKASLRVEAVGTGDELNSAIGVAIAQVSRSKYSVSRIKKELTQIQSDLFEIGAVLATPKDTQLTKGMEIHRALPAYLKNRVEEMEQTIDVLTQKLTPMKAFILPSGSVAGSSLHLARAICRRAERRVIALAKKEPIEPQIVIYINRLADLLFTMARYVNMREKQPETEWYQSSSKPRKK